MRHPCLALSALSLTLCLSPRDAQAQGTTTRGQDAGTTSGAARRAGAQPGCRLDGTWELVSMTVDGKDSPLAGYQQRKVIADGRYMWLGQAARRDTLPMRTAADTVLATAMSGGAGTFTLAGNTYTEKLEYFLDPSQLGKSMRATCRTEGDRWYHSFTLPFDTTAARGPVQHVVELWRRIP